MNKSYQSIRGMNDTLPDTVALWQQIEAVLRASAALYGYEEIRFPLLEMTEVFTRSIGNVTDIVEKEMYTFLDRNGDSLSLRPEGTAGCVRAAIQNGLLHNQTQRLWYLGPMFRHERPQQGRYRQFHQFGVEAMGFADPDVDVELILLSARIWQRLGLGSLKLTLNSLGSTESRANYRAALMAYYQQHESELDADAKRRLHLNPLRILDSKNPTMIALNQAAPVLVDYLDDACAQHFDQVQSSLHKHGVAFKVEPRLVRGLDYYNRTVFEWIGDGLGSQATLCAGGRYDALVAQMGGKPTPACGFAIGLERLIHLYQQQQTDPTPITDIYLIHVGGEVQDYAVKLAESLRTKLNRPVICHAGGGSLKRQFKRANKLNARVALVVGDDEYQTKRCTIKLLQQDVEQVTVAVSAVVEYLSNREIWE